MREFAPGKALSEKSVVRPTYSYLGGYKISEKVTSDIAECVRREDGNITELSKVSVFPVPGGRGHVRCDKYKIRDGSVRRRLKEARRTLPVRSKK